MKPASLPTAILFGLALMGAANFGAFVSKPDDAEAATASTTPRERTEHVIYASGETARIDKEADGHFWTTAYVNSMPVRFLVDTGASVVVLTEQDARSIGVDPNDLPRRASVMTANGRVEAGVAKLGRVRINGLEARNVDAMVLSTGLEHSLLGMSFLNQFSHWEASRDAITIRR